MGLGLESCGRGGSSLSALLDTHFVLWILEGHPRLGSFPWLDRYRPWTLSPVGLLELQFLAEIGRIQLAPGFWDALRSDPRFQIDDPPVGQLIAAALPLGWTRDPFDRLLAAHSLARRLPLCTVDRVLCTHHANLVPEVARP